MLYTTASIYLAVYYLAIYVCPSVCRLSTVWNNDYKIDWQQLECLTQWTRGGIFFEELLSCQWSSIKSGCVKYKSRTGVKG